MGSMPVQLTLENQSLVVDLGLVLLSSSSHIAFHMTND